MLSLRAICADVAAASSFKLEPGLQNDFSNAQARTEISTGTSVFRENKVTDPTLSLDR